MGGGLMQLVAYGAQDIYLTGNPQITFFKVVYRRHTNFSMEAIEQTLNGSASFGGSQTATISRNGDLVGQLYVEWNAATTLGNDHTATYAGNTLLSEIELEIGGQRIDKHTGHWLSTYNMLTAPNASGEIVAIAGSQAAGAYSGATNYQNMSCNHYYANVDPSGPTSAYIPLQFWFCRNPGLALPLIALQYHEVKIKITYCQSTHISGTATMGTPKLWADYYYLDTDERRRFAQVSHEYLIEQLQYTSFGTGTSFDLNFNHPVKELIWTGIGTSIVAGATAQGPGAPYVTNDSYGPGSCASATTWKLVLNGHDRFAARDSRYFTRTQIWQHHTGYGGLKQVGLEDSIAVYSFALKPEEHQPSGTCNFSRIDNAQLISSVSTASSIWVFAVNYNVLRVMSGMGGLAYSN